MTCALGYDVLDGRRVLDVPLRELGVGDGGRVHLRVRGRPEVGLVVELEADALPPARPPW